MKKSGNTKKKKPTHHFRLQFQDEGIVSHVVLAFAVQKVVATAAV